MKGIDFDKLDFSEKPREGSRVPREFGEFGTFCMFLGSLVKSGGRLDLLGCAFAPGEFKKQSAPSPSRQGWDGSRIAGRRL